jgi:protein involved in polysaccharide export with SLBB domain
MKKLLALLLILTTSASAQDATFRAGDSLEIRIGSVPAEETAHVSGQYMVDSQGYVNLPHIGKVRASGSTPDQLQSAIESAYKSGEIYTNPTISITMLGGGAQRFVNVSGEVKGGGRITYTSDLTLLTAITAAGGFTDFADAKNVQLIRGGQRQRVNLREVRRDPSRDIKLLPGDTIIIPQSLF